MRIVFIGDSITELGKFEDPEALGTGYVRLLYDYFITAYPANDFEVINKGISGNRIDDLATRWQTDVIDVNPDIVSISIGINDVWRQLKDPTMPQIYPEEFKNNYNDLLQQVSDNTSADIVLMEPTIIEENLDSIGNQKLKPYVEIVNTMAEKHDAYLVPTHQAFLSYLEANNGYALTTDGVHMNSTGNMLMAKAWYETVKDILFFTSKK